MSPAPPPVFPLFDFGQIGSLGIILILLFLAAGLTLFFLSFSNRHGRSRWPLHALMALGITAVGTGLAFGATAGVSMFHVLTSLSTSGGGDPAKLAQMVIGSLVAPFWLGIVGALLGILAGIRAILGLIREPGPRF